MICTLAKHSKRAVAVTAVAADSEILALVDEYIDAQKRYGDLATRADEMQMDYGTPPEAPRIRPCDLDELGRKPPLRSTDEFWHRPCDIDQWRSVDGVKSKCREKGDRSILVTWKVRASEELRSRAAEIVTSYEEWRSKGRPRRGYKKALRESREAERNYIRLERKIARRHDRWDVGKDSTRPWGYRGALRSITGGCEEAMTLSVFNDIQRMTDAASS